MLKTIKVRVGPKARAQKRAQKIDTRKSLYLVRASKRLLASLLSPRFIGGFTQGL